MAASGAAPPTSSARDGRAGALPGSRDDRAATPVTEASERISRKGRGRIALLEGSTPAPQGRPASPRIEDERLRAHRQGERSRAYTLMQATQCPAPTSRSWGTTS